LKKNVFSTLFLLTILLATIAPVAISVFSKTTAQETDIISKFEPWLYDKVRALNANGTLRRISLIIRLVDGSYSGVPLRKNQNLR